MNLTPQQRLSSSRLAIVQSMGRDRREDRQDETLEESLSQHAEEEFASSGGASGPNRTHSSGLNGLWRAVRRATSVWWRSHPACLTVDVVQPMVESYAKANPLKLIGFSAAAGAVLVMAKPWRLISVTGVLVAALKSTQMTSLIASVLSSPPTEPHDT